MDSHPPGSCHHRAHLQPHVRQTSSLSRLIQALAALPLSDKESHMNTEKIEGKFDQVTGKIKQGVGEAVGNQKLANAGAAEQIKGAAKETWGHAKDAAGAVKEENRSQAAAKGEELKYRAEESAHNLREKITTTAQDVKDKVSE